MQLFHKKTPDEKAAEEAERERQREAQDAYRATAVERASRIRAAEAAIEAFQAGQAPKWDYKIMYRTRRVDREHEGFHETGSWNRSITDMFPQLGDEGWELVAAWPLSGVGGSLRAGVGPAVGGVTTEEMWVFKRPKHPVPEELAQALSEAQAYGQ